ncbi:MAG TPA: 4-(cytidine 5'-diphospho)-2-C-methyl-D-erythritol kinase [Clostridia bacterium]
MKSSAYAKINLSLIITGVKDGYHLLDSIMVSCKNLKDDVVIKKSKKDKIKFLGNSKGIDLENNTVIKAVRLFRENGFDIPPLSIKIKKRIPVMAGLGGSSADAACAIRMLCRMFKIDLRHPAVLKIAQAIGSDAPYMLNANACRVTGTGNQVQPVNNNLKLKAVIAMDYPVSTKQSFEAFDKLNLNGSDAALNDLAVKALEESDFELLKDNMVNDLEKASCAVAPEIIGTKQKLTQAGAISVLMTGSGGAFFALSQDKATQDKIYKSLKNKVKYLFKTDIF